MHLMQSGNLENLIVGEYEKVEDARKHEAVLFQKYKQLEQAKLNKKMH